MELAIKIKELGERVIRLKDSIQTEEATKTALIMPFFQILGFDVFDPLEVCPEYIADIGTKKGEKVDYLILKEGVPIIIVECKHLKENLDLHDGQLLRYFHVSKARFGLLTNGKQYRFYTDLEEPNKMDSKPFLEFDVSDISENQIEQLRKFHKQNFDIESIVSVASELKYTGAIRAVLSQEFNNPSEELVKMITGRVYNGRQTAKVLEQFTSLTKKSASQFLSDAVTERLKAALVKEVELHNRNLIHSLMSKRTILKPLLRRWRAF